jgi:transcriptional regulator with XRE-family HTH domain
MTLIERLRCDRGLGQFEVETATGVNHKTLVKYEQALSDRIAFERLAVIARFYDVAPSVLLQDIREVYALRVARDQELRDAA